MADKSDVSQEFKEFIKFGKFFSTRLLLFNEVQAVVQARLGCEQFVALPCKQFVDPVDWFNVRIDELGDVSAQLRSNITSNCISYPPLSPSLTLDFLLQTKDDGILPCISYEGTRNGELKEENGRFMRTELYQQLSVVLRSVIAAARVTPSYRYFVRKQSSSSYIILYRALID
uniref:Autophagy-related protein 101 n=1 Tax=Syphacia muris TaxID=451379 RepID=A0A0N5ARU3_9BILA